MKTTISITATPNCVVNLRTILRPLFTSLATPIVSATRNSADIRLVHNEGRAPKAATSLVPWRERSAAKLANMTLTNFTVTRAEGTMSRAAGISNLKAIGIEDLALPPGLDRYINARTLKALFKAGRSDILLRNSGEAWVPCADSDRIDLLDESTEYRLGPIAIYS